MAAVNDTLPGKGPRSSGTCGLEGSLIVHEDSDQYCNQDQDCSCSQIQGRDVVGLSAEPHLCTYIVGRATKKKYCGNLNGLNYVFQSMSMIVADLAATVSVSASACLFAYHFYHVENRNRR